MGKGLPLRDSAGESAAAEGRRARRSVVRRRLGSASLAIIGAVSATAWWVTRDRWLVGATLAAAALAWRFRPAADPDRWTRGALGEVATARLLAQLPRRYVVLHDRRPPDAAGNLDHLIIGPSGVWLVDSKHRRARLHVRRGQVWAGEWPIDVGPVVRQAVSVQDALGLRVAALVAVHGDGLRRRGKNVSGVRVLPAWRLTHHIRRPRRGRRLPKREVVALAARADWLFPAAAHRATG